MEMSWRAGRAVTTESISTISDGIAVRAPVADAVRDMKETVDDVVHVSDDETVEAMRMLMNDAGLIVEPAGAVGLAAAKKLRDTWGGGRIAVIVTGGNITPDQIRSWLLSPPAAPR